MVKTEEREKAVLVTEIGLAIGIARVPIAMPCANFSCCSSDWLQLRVCVRHGLLWSRGVGYELRLTMGARSTVVVLLNSLYFRSLEVSCDPFRMRMSGK